jgi:hypothetical protein
MEQMTVRFKPAPSKRAIRNWLAFADGATEVEQPPERKPTGPQKETAVNKVVQALWSAIKRGALYRNRRGMVDLASGAKMPIGLGPNGTGDVIGYSLVRITPAMLNRVLPVYTELESKTDTGRLAPHQLARIEELRDLNAIAGCVRSAEDAESIYRSWIEKQEGR